MPRFRVIAHRRVQKFLRRLDNERVKSRITKIIAELEDYPLILRRIDVKKLESLKKTYRARVGNYRIIFFVDRAERTIYVTHVGKREPIYKR